MIYMYMHTSLQDVSSVLCMFLLLLSSSWRPGIEASKAFHISLNGVSLMPMEQILHV